MFPYFTSVKMRTKNMIKPNFVIVDNFVHDDEHIIK